MENIVLRYYRCLVIAGFILIGHNAYTQDVIATAKLDASVIKIGDQVKLHLTVQYPSSYIINWATPPDSMGNVEVVETSKVDTVGRKDSTVITQTQTLTITAFDSGYYPIPPFVFHYKKGKDTNDFVAETQAILLTVNTIPVDTAKGFKEIKNVMDTPYSFAEFWEQNKWFVIAGILAVLLIIGLIIYLKKRKKVIHVVEEKIIKRPAHEIALEELKKVEEEKLWQGGFIKKYYSSVSDVIRMYIENRYGIIAMELTTDEILLQFKNRMIHTEAKDKLTQVLQLSDLVKFAKVEPLPNEHDLTLSNAYNFVYSTTLKEEPIVQEQPQIEITNQSQAIANQPAPIVATESSIPDEHAKYMGSSVKNKTPENNG